MEHCQCEECKWGLIHKSDCAVHNMPAHPNGECNCGVIPRKEEMVFPCCKEKLPASLDKVELATCSCGQSFSPKVIIDYNEMVYIITGWRDVINGKARLKAETSEDAKFISNLMLRGLKFTTSEEVT